MLTRLRVRNFKRFDDVDVELGNPVVFIGPNNSGKTTAMQALALWDAGLRRWLDKRPGGAPQRRPGVTVNRRDLTAIPVPSANLLWRGLKTRRVQRVGDGPQRTDNIRIDITVDGVTEDTHWSCGLEFDYANEESFYCRPLRTTGGREPKRMPVPDAAGAARIAFLPPMSGLAATETRLQPGAVDVRIGEGRTAEVLRNLCFRVRSDRPEEWERLVERIARLFGARLDDPRSLEERGEIAMTYCEAGARLDLSSSGRGLQQTLLILAYLCANPGAVLLLDEPDAHLEIFRQKQIYRLLVETAQRSGSQIVAASHSEVLLNEAAGRDLVVAFVGKPHRIDHGRTAQLKKALGEIGWEQYYQAEQKGWVLYLEGSTDLEILRNFAQRLGHEAAMEALGSPFVHYCGNERREAERHFYGLREAVPDLRGLALFDQLDPLPPEGGHLPILVWRRREIENYLCTQATLESWARASGSEEREGPLFARARAGHRVDAMLEAIDEAGGALRTLGKGSPWDGDMKVSDEFLAPVFENWFGKLRLPNLMRKKSFYELVAHVPEAEIDPEVGEKLAAVADLADPPANRWRTRQDSNL